MQELHKKYTTRPDRKSTFAKASDFLLEDGLKMFEDANTDIADSYIKFVFPLSKQQVC